MRMPVYIIIKRTGQEGADGRELIIVYDVKLSRSAADKVVEDNPETEVMKFTADNTQ